MISVQEICRLIWYKNGASRSSGAFWCIIRREPLSQAPTRPGAAFAVACEDHRIRALWRRMSDRHCCNYAERDTDK
jgi:hypothetical protein